MYFQEQLKDLADAGIEVVEMIQGSADMREAWDEFYGHINAGKQPRLAAPLLSAPGGEIYAKHIRNTIGVKTERGWKVSKRTATSPIDAVAAGAMSAWAATRIEDLAYTTGGIIYG
jgi:phage terminase large subunit-like protein